MSGLAWAVAEIIVVKINLSPFSWSPFSYAGKGLIGSGSGNFVAQSVPNKAGDMVYRGIDTEYKILDNIADQLGSNTSARGAVNILTEKAACASWAVAEAECNTVTGLKQVHHAATPLPLS
ncbi:hypothetical protein JTM05_32425 [Pseudomonas aeruginosa]|nr:hypothetical protein [Pseudomonas aeruginosa]